MLGAFVCRGEIELDSRGGAKLVTTSCEEDGTCRLHLVILMARHDLRRLRNRVGEPGCNTRWARQAIRRNPWSARYTRVE
jgi:hypothetical protein